MMTYPESYILKIGDKAPDFTLKATSGKEYSLNDLTKPVMVLFFTCNHCPYARAYDQRIRALIQEFRHKADFVGINSNDDINYPQDSFDNMKALAKEKKFTYLYLWDESQEVARAYGGQVTPQFFVFGNGRKLEYQGRLDDNIHEPEAAETSELRDAIAAVLAGKKPEEQVTSAHGCSIKWKA